MSFAFTADEEDSENGVSYEKIDERGTDGKDVWIRHVKKVTGLYDVTIAGHPAYPQTDLAMREIDEFFDKKLGHVENEKERQLREAKEAEDKAKREEEERKIEEAAERARQAQMFRLRAQRRKHSNLIY